MSLIPAFLRIALKNIHAFVAVGLTVSLVMAWACPLLTDSWGNQMIIEPTAGGVVMDDAEIKRHVDDIARFTLTRPIALMVLVLGPLLWLWTGLMFSAASWRPLMLALVLSILMIVGFVVMIRRSASRGVRAQYPIGSRVVAEVDGDVLRTWTALSRGETSFALLAGVSIVGSTVAMKRRGGSSVAFLPAAAFSEAHLDALQAAITR
ncbi:hypothetical protein [Microbacterium azadirachtae]|uniref:hypothetical protein n=1 Tax=Microbacterium azadirachtae TaxID=582680 RepID=UPI003F750827